MSARVRYVGRGERFRKSVRSSHGRAGSNEPQTCPDLLHLSASNQAETTSSASERTTEHSHANLTEAETEVKPASGRRLPWREAGSLDHHDDIVDFGPVGDQ